ncbi:MAG: lytic transglycosylase domain-containing protein, partial [Myxococcota bacterium]
AADLVVPSDPAAAADRLITAERKIRDPSVSDGDAGLWGHVQQRVYRALANDEVLANAVLGSIPPELKPAVEKCLFGTREIALTVTKPKTDLPDWRIVPARPIGELKGFYEASAARHGVPWTALASVHLNETRTGRLRGTSPAGAKGPMQFMPATWAEFGLGGDIEKEQDAIEGAANYLAKSGWATDKRKAIWAYNHSDHYINAILAFMEVMDAEPAAHRGLWGWQVYYRTASGSIWLEEGYEQHERIPISQYCEGKGEPYCPKIH